MERNKFAYKFDYPTTREQVLYLYGHKPDDEAGLLYSTKQQLVSWLLGYWDHEETELRVVK